VANEAKRFAAAAVRGAQSAVEKAKSRLQEALGGGSGQEPVGFAETEFYLPVFFGLTGGKVETLMDVQKPVEEAESLLGPLPADNISLPYLGTALDAGIASLFAQEAIAAIESSGEQKVNELQLGPPSDHEVKRYGAALADGSVKGFAGLIGAAPGAQSLKDISMELVNQNFYVFLAGSDSDISADRQLAREGMELGWDHNLLSFDSRFYGHVLTLGFLVRMAMMLGDVNPGDSRRIFDYCERIFGFFMILQDLDDERYSFAAGATSFGFLTIAPTYVQQLLPIHTLHRLR
jgi:acetyl-CoA synthase